MPAPLRWGDTLAPPQPACCTKMRSTIGSRRVRTTENQQHARRPLGRTARRAGRLVAGCLVCVALFAVAGCSGSQGTGTGIGSADDSSTVGARMAGPVVDVKVTQEALDNKPKPPVLTTPESAVRSYLDWVSYAYRIGQSEVALPTMTTYEEVHVDSYIQYNVQKRRLIDQTLDSITFGESSVQTSNAVVPTKEKWTYRYVSVETAGKTIEGPYSATYDVTYALIKATDGDWVVDSVDAKAQGTVK